MDHGILNHGNMRNTAPHSPNIHITPTSGCMTNDSHPFSEVVYGIHDPLIPNVMFSFLLTRRYFGTDHGILNYGHMRKTASLSPNIQIIPT
ncbi:hypothetical protein AVEN_177106-1 [Araneus ventricosus]|uniref:Uncharacterized protein n=1 Tax=Araneus ventricosus TaxID=182803 RepID=A0A4Y2HM05_ARAVE|nr:hypothetical protein AVEN_88787-1 [Araneus ventricosus]GBM66424.1 hypothetical protein AVEN_177106-1 [Araneus ventricosus]